MWGRKRESDEPAAEPQASSLRDALRQARIESAERTGVIVDLRDAEVARLEALNEALDPLFKDIPSDVELFDRGISRGEPARLWIDIVSYVIMGRDKRTYRFLQDGRHGRIILAESPDTGAIVEAVTKYVARRLIERERAVASDDKLPTIEEIYDIRRRRRWQAARDFTFGLLVGFAALLLVLWWLATRS
jgi:hypothetical protein